MRKFLLRAFRTSGCIYFIWTDLFLCNSCCMPVFLTHLPYQTFSLFIMGNSCNENISWVGFINNFDFEATFGKKLSVHFRYWFRLSLFFFSQKCLKPLLLKFQSFPRRLSVVCFCHGRMITLKPILFVDWASSLWLV